MSNETVVRGSRDPIAALADRYGFLSAEVFAFKWLFDVLEGETARVCGMTDFSPEAALEYLRAHLDEGFLMPPNAGEVRLGLVSMVKPDHEPKNERSVAFISKATADAYERGDWTEALVIRLRRRWPAVPSDVT